MLSTRELSKPKIIKNVLSKNEINLLIDVTQEAQKYDHKSFISTWWGRITTNIDVPKEIKEKFHSIAKEYDPNIFETNHNSFTYSGKYGKHTSLSPHQDQGGNEELFLDYQVRSNISWPLYVEGEKFVLEDNDILVFGGTSYVHWREEKFLTEDEYVQMFDICYARPGYQEGFILGKNRYEDDLANRMDEALKLYNPSIDVWACVSSDQKDHSRCSHD